MSVNSSSPSNDTLVHTNIFSVHSDMPIPIFCLITRPLSFIYIPCFLTYILLLLPLGIFIIHHGLQQWREKRSTSSAAVMSHSDSFTYNMVTMELTRVFGLILLICGIFSDHLNILTVGFFIFSFTWFGEIFFHILTCVERYLAVVHPITYLSLRKERGIRIRNISNGCVWLICFVETSLLKMGPVIFIVNYFLLISCVILVSFCSISVLCVLIRPGPGEQGGIKKRVDQSKQRAFYTIMVILGVLVVRFTGDLAWSVLLFWSDGMMMHDICLVSIIDFWLNLPSSLVLPLLFLIRGGKLVCWKKNIQ